mmetsp:Transcript_10025/g.17048  ORF Transcript_10025/g.17048 Transcript_10025/m.17048 type:complete len:134 (-) Transcript_10025:262-663(-)
MLRPLLAGMLLGSSSLWAKHTMPTKINSCSSKLKTVLFVQKYSICNVQNDCNEPHAKCGRKNSKKKRQKTERNPDSGTNLAGFPIRLQGRRNKIIIPYNKLPSLFQSPAPLNARNFELYLPVVVIFVVPVTLF